MKIAISSTGKDLESDIDFRFGRCPFFLIVNIENNEIKDFKAIENIAAGQMGGAGVTSSQLVANEKVEAVITGNIGPRAFDVFNQLKIKVYQTKGKIKQEVKDFIDGKLKSINNPTGPQHKGL